jgi:hypothetical protein
MTLAPRTPPFLRSATAPMKSHNLFFSFSMGSYPHSDGASSIKRLEKTDRGWWRHSSDRTIACVNLCWTSSVQWGCTQPPNHPRDGCSRIPSAPTTLPCSSPSSFTGRRRRSSSTTQSGARSPNTPRTARQRPRCAKSHWGSNDVAQSCNDAIAPEGIGGGSHEPMLVEGDQGDDVAIRQSRLSSSPGTTHSNASVLAGRRPRLTRLSMRAWMMSEQHHGSMRQ